MVNNVIIKHRRNLLISEIICFTSFAVVNLAWPNSSYGYICLVIASLFIINFRNFIRIERVDMFISRTECNGFIFFKRKRVKSYFKRLLYNANSNIDGMPFINIIMQIVVGFLFAISIICFVVYIVERIGNHDVNEQFWKNVFRIQCLVVLIVNFCIDFFLHGIYSYCASKGDKYAKEYLFSSTRLFQIFKKSREEQQTVKEIKRLSILQSEIKKYQCSKYKGEYCIDSTDIQEIEDLISKQYPEVYVEYHKKNGKSVLTIYQKSTQAVLFSSTVVKK